MRACGPAGTHRTPRLSHHVTGDKIETARVGSESPERGATRRSGRWDRWAALLADSPAGPINHRLRKQPLASLILMCSLRTASRPKRTRTFREGVLELDLLKTIDAELDDLRWRLGRRGRRFTDARVARAFLWSVMCDRPLTWLDTPMGRMAFMLQRSPAMPTSSTICRRLQDPRLTWLLEELLFGLSYSTSYPQYFTLDSKALPVSPYSKDEHATAGYGRCEMQRGYKLHVLSDNRNRVWAWEVLPMHIDEVETVQLLLPRAAQRRGGGGIVLTDTGYARAGKEFAERCGFRLICPWDRSSRADDSPRWTREDRIRRDSIERFFGNLSGFGGGLQGLPAWVRTPHRVRLWVLGKLIINAARQRRLRGSDGPPHVSGSRSSGWVHPNAP